MPAGSVLVRGTGVVLIAAAFIGSAHAEQTAKQLFGHVERPAPAAPEAIGFYSRGCLAGAQELPVTGPTWQVMRLSRNRNWGHPSLIRYIERLATDVHDKDGWPGLLVGDLAQPRGGPMVSSHASHQIGLDVDIWFRPMPDRTLTRKERETMSAYSLLKSNFAVNPDTWQPGYVALLKRAASYPQVERIFVAPEIKQQLCEAAGTDRDWLRHIRPYWGHKDHFHVRLRCPAASPSCKAQHAPPPGDGCGQPLAWWFDMFRHPPKPKPHKPKPELTLDDLPDACAIVLNGGALAAVPLPSRKPAHHIR